MSNEAMMHGAVLMGLIAQKYPGKVPAVNARIADLVEQFKGMDQPGQFAEFVAVTMAAIKMGEALE